MIKATLGFVFTPDLTQILLIRKNRPDWQVGKINGLGGKCEEGESFTECISREVKEEANILIPPKKWRAVAELHWQKWEVKVLTAIWPNSLNQVSSMTDEKVEWVNVNALPTTTMSNLAWLIPLCIDAFSTPELVGVDVHYT